MNHFISSKLAFTFLATAIVATACDATSAPSVSTDATFAELSTTGADASDSAEGEVNFAGENLTLWSSVTGVHDLDGSIPSGIKLDDVVSFSMPWPSDATPIAPLGDACGGREGCSTAAWSFAPTTFTLSYSSGFVRTGTIDRIEMTDGGSQSFDGSAILEADELIFFQGRDEVYELQDMDGTWHQDGVHGAFGSAMVNIFEPGLFEVSFYWGEWGDWGTYHYDHTQDQGATHITLE
jgi:hypothetical protein